MRIATWNLWGLNGDYVQRFQMILAEVRELSCDLICFQELGLAGQPQVISDFVEQLRLLGYNLYTCDLSGPLRKSELVVASGWSPMSVKLYWKQMLQILTREAL